MKPPKTKKIEKVLEIHGDRRIDPYFWLNERENPDVIKYLEEENDYCGLIMRDTEDLQQKLFEEMKARYKKDDESIPYFFNKYWYSVRYEEGKEYSIFCRRHGSPDSPEEIILDENILAEGNEYYEIGSLAVSPGNDIAAFSEDKVGRRLFTIRFKNLSTGEFLEDEIANTAGKAVWANDNQHVFYVKKSRTLRSYKVYRHKIGTDPAEDLLVYHEKDTSFDVSIYKAKSQEFIFIAASNSVSDEHRFIPADDVDSDWKIIAKRAKNFEYAVEHFQDQFYIITNADGAENFKLITTPVAQPSRENWKDLVPYRPEILLEGFEVFKDYLVLEEREKGLLRLKIIESATGEAHYLQFSDPAYTAYIGLNLEFNTAKLRYGYTSLTKPAATLEYDMKSRETTVIRKQEVLGGTFKEENYVSERIWARSRDGKNEIPISLVYHKDTKKSADTPLLLYGYGSYGHTVDAGFSAVRLSLLDRGFIYAIAHIRGGEYLGRHWYEDGKMLAKRNTFYDFVDAAGHLIAESYTSPRHMYAMGGSAGGLLVGAVLNMAPELFHGAVAQVPFVDVVTTMLDETIPLTAGEYEEWGDPRNEEYYHYMKSYSPYDNISQQQYPHLLVTTGLHDSQVQYWEPAKWVAKLRDCKSDNNLLLFKTDMSSGHGGASGRFESFREDALEFAFLLKLENYRP